MLPQRAVRRLDAARPACGLRAAGRPEDDAELLFPGGAGGHDRGVLRPGRPPDGGGSGDAGARRDCACRSGCGRVIALRLRQNRPHKEAVRRARRRCWRCRATRGSRPRCTGAHRGCRSGTPPATDRRISAGTPSGRSWPAIYTATVLYWLRDTSEDDAATLAFLDRRLAGAGRITPPAPPRRRALPPPRLSRLVSPPATSAVDRALLLPIVRREGR